MVLADEDVESVEDYDDGEEDDGEPRCVWLEVRAEHESVAINSLCLERLVELEVGDADRAPCEEGGNGGQVLEPCKDERWTTRGDGQVCEAGDEDREDDAPVWDTGLAAAEKEAWSLLVLCKGEKITGSGVEESVRR